VTVRIDGSTPEYVRIEVHNMGTIPPAIIPWVFEPMIGGDRRRDGSRGLGLGLYISREIIRAHGGHIDVRSSDEAGTTFTVSLPRVAAPVCTSDR
jgi:signal transduction histidine kinase